MLMELDGKRLDVWPGWLGKIESLSGFFVISSSKLCLISNRLKRALVPLIEICGWRENDGSGWKKRAVPSLRHIFPTLSA